VIASFGSSDPYSSKAFDLTIKHDPSVPEPKVDKPLRYGKLPEINHVFKPDAKSPPKIITLFFTAIVLAAFPVLLGAVSKHTPRVRR
jgi:oligosaccharyltransferase complex subunit delta (ribophorin II)